MPHTRAELYIQCYVEGQKGDFLGIETPMGRVSVSPVFQDLDALFSWTHANGWRNIGRGRYIKEEAPSTPAQIERANGRTWSK